MRAFLLFLATFLLAPAATARPATDWSRHVTVTPGGAFVLGDPRASRLIEYISYTCPHCAHFVAEGSGPLRDQWVRKGVLSVEVRNAALNAYDLTAAILVRCGGKDRFFADHAAVFAWQDAWMDKVKAFADARGDAAVPADKAAFLREIAAGTGLSDMLARRGLPVARQRQCLADPGTLRIVEDMTKDALDAKKITGTPSFILSGRLLDAHSWDALRPSLPALPK